MFRTKSRHVVPNVVQVGPGLECTERIAGRQKWRDKLFFSGNLTNKNGDTRIGMDRIYTIGCHGDIVKIVGYNGDPVAISQVVGTVGKSLVN